MEKRAGRTDTHAKEQINPRPNASYTNYQYPQVLSDGTVVAQKSGIDDIETLMFLTPGGEEKKFVQGYLECYRNVVCCRIPDRMERISL